MAIQFQYNKTSLQALEKNLNMRVRALPTIKNKESALRVEVKKAKDEIQSLEQELENRILSYDKMLALWGEFDTSSKKLLPFVFLCWMKLYTRLNLTVCSTPLHGMQMAWRN